jgi:RND family efflux transporter MFP subunit
MPLWKQLILSCLVVLGASAVWQYRAQIGAVLPGTGGAAAPAPPSSEDRGAPVIVAEVRERADDLTFTAIGTGFAQRSVTLRAPAGGEITALEAAPGRKFRAGATLMRLDATDARLAVALAEARLARATSERDRYRRLQDSGAAPPARLEDAETEYRVAEIALEQARADLADRTLTAPFDGVTGLARVEVGDRIAQGDAISSFDDRSRILVEFDLPEALLGRVATGQAVSAATASAEGRRFDGEITAIDSRVDAATRTARVRAAIDNPADVLRPGASFSLRLELPGPTYPAVPELALRFARGEMHVWRVADGRAERVTVRLVRRRDGKVIVDGPLAPGDRVVTEGTQRLRPGRRVEVLNTAAEGRS